MGKRQGMHYFCRIGAQKNHPEGWLRCGAADEARTRYLHLGKVALYQMSYGRMAESLVLSRSLRATNAIIWHSM